MKIIESTKTYSFNQKNLEKAMKQAFAQGDHYEFTKNIKELAKKNNEQNI